MGVGASAPQASLAVAKEATKLRNQLLSGGKKRDHGQTRKHLSSSDSEDLEKGRGSRFPIKKTGTSIDPFTINRPKKTKKAKTASNGAGHHDDVLKSGGISFSEDVLENQATGLDNSAQDMDMEKEEEWSGMSDSESFEESSQGPLVISLGRL